MKRAQSKYRRFQTHATLICPEHQRPAWYRDRSDHVYNGRDYGHLWECQVMTCDRIVGCHPNGEPLGELATKSLRQLRRKAHDAFDGLWNTDDAQRLAYPEEKQANKKLRGAMRNRAYGWLAEQMGMTRDDCHIGMMDEVQAAMVVEILKEHQPTSASIRAWHKAKVTAV